MPAAHPLSKIRRESVQRFVLQQNIERFRRLHDDAAEEADRRRLQLMIATAERELALLNAGLTGVLNRPLVGEAARQVAESRAGLIAKFRAEFAEADRPAILIDPEPGLAIVEANAAYESASGLARDALVGQPLFLLFPDNPEDATADGVSHLYASLRRVAETGRAHAMPTQRYDVRDDDGQFVERHWRPVNSALTDDRGRVVYLLHQVEDVTAEVMDGRAGR